MAFKNFRKGKRPKENKQESSNKFEQPDRQNDPTDKKCI